MTTLTHTTTATESAIRNGSSNLNYSFDQFLTLTNEQQKAFLWTAVVQTGAIVEYSQVLPEHYEVIFMTVQNIAAQKKQTPVAKINGREIFSAAQGMTLLAYGDSDAGEAANIKCRSLDYNVKCEDFSDLAACLHIIEQYNNFESGEVVPMIEQHGRKIAFYHPDNCNNQNEVFGYHIAREGSPAFYISFNEYLSPKIEVSRNGAEVTHTPYTGKDFKQDMEILSALIKADSFTIEERTICGTSTSFTARFWFD